MGVLVNVTGSMDIGLEEVEQAATLVQQAANPEALIIFGATFDETLEDEIRVTVIATGFDDNKPPVTSTPFTKAAEKVEAKTAEPEKPGEKKAETQGDRLLKLASEEPGKTEDPEDEKRFNDILEIFKKKDY
ncbi:Cell division protein FtsZ [bioreactor metagenome]|uniref:Cell division protein FtsZ n=1 Tax=bioreactor metagenome TaxID=1076179 RepID=A0A645G3T5_9ZZZZ